MSLIARTEIVTARAGASGARAVPDVVAVPRYPISTSLFVLSARQSTPPCCQALSTATWIFSASRRSCARRRRKKTTLLGLLPLVLAPLPAWLDRRVAARPHLRTRHRAVAAPRPRNLPRMLLRESHTGALAGPRSTVTRTSRPSSGNKRSSAPASNKRIIIILTDQNENQSLVVKLKVPAVTRVLGSALAYKIYHNCVIRV